MISGSAGFATLQETSASVCVDIDNYKQLVMTKPSGTPLVVDLVVCMRTNVRTCPDNVRTCPDFSILKIIDPPMAEKTLKIHDAVIESAQKSFPTSESSYIMSVLIFSTIHVVGI